MNVKTKSVWLITVLGVLIVFNLGSSIPAFSSELTGRPKEAPTPISPPVQYDTSPSPTPSDAYKDRKTPERETRPTRDEREERSGPWENPIGFLYVLSIVFVVIVLGGAAFVGFRYYLHHYYNRSRRLETHIPPTGTYNTPPVGRTKTILEGSGKPNTVGQERRYPQDTLSLKPREVTTEPWRNTGEYDSKRTDELHRLQNDLHRLQIEVTSRDKELHRLQDELHRLQVEVTSRDPVSLLMPLANNLRAMSEEFESALRRLKTNYREMPIERLEQAVSRPQKSDDGEDKRSKLSDDLLIKWWNEFGTEGTAECEAKLKEKFRDTELQIILPGRFPPDDWRIIGIQERTQGSFFYVLPRKADRWWTDGYPHSDYKKWFELEEEREDSSLTIWSIKSPLPKASFIHGQWELVSQRGKVSIREPQ